MNNLTPLLGVDKSNPLLELLVNPDFPDEILVHYGMHLLETVHRGPDSLEEKLLAGRLYNAKLKRSELARIFRRDIKTIRNYAEALKSGDAEKLRSVLAGQGPKPKIGSGEDYFIRQTFREIYPHYGCHSNTYIRSDLESKFNVKVSYETIRKIINNEKQKMNLHQVSEAESDCNVECMADHTVKYQQENTDKKAGILSEEKENSCEKRSRLSSNSDKNYNYSPCFEIAKGFHKINGKIQFVFHGGLFLVLDDIMRITQSIGQIKEIACQWLGSVLCGAVNIEQSIGLNFESLSLILQQNILSDEAQRQYLRHYGSTNAILELRKANMKYIGADVEDTFLYDPHGIEYTGQAHILKGWLGSKHKVAKAYYQDFIHTLDGKPAAAFLEDNYDDILGRFPRNITQFRQLLSGDQNRSLTFVVDRAIYSLDDLRKYREQSIYVITWEKGCINLLWAPEDKDVGGFSFMRYRNHGQDAITYRVEHYSELWKRDENFKRHLARVYKGDLYCGVVLSVICTDSSRGEVEVLEPILRRWVQENDILYLINEFGINQITSYGKVNYADVADMIEDRQFTNPNTRKISAKKLALRQKLGVQIVKHNDRVRQLEIEQEHLESIKEKINGQEQPDDKLKKNYNRLKASAKAKTKRLHKTTENLDQLKINYQQEMAYLDDQLKEEPNTLSRLESLIEKKYQTLNLGPKTVMDAIRIASRNIFGQHHEQIRPLYNNYRNDHRILRELIRVPALIEYKENLIDIKLIPTRNFQKKQKQCIQKFLNKFNDRYTSQKQSPTLKISIYSSNIKEFNS
jgi:hypothetical protein